MTDPCVSTGVNFLAGAVRILNSQVSALSNSLGITGVESDNQTIVGSGLPTDPITLLRAQFPTTPGATGYLRDTIIAANPTDPAATQTNFTVEVPFTSDGYGIVMGIDHTFPTNGTVSGSAVLSGIGSTITDNVQISVISGGSGNTIQNPGSFPGQIIYGANIIGGADNLVQAEYATVLGGSTNAIRSPYSTIISSSSSEIKADSDNSTIIGLDNTINANCAESLACGRLATCAHPRSFVWSATEATQSFGNDTFTVRSHGGVNIYTASGTLTGVSLSSGGGSWASLSDRNQKENLIHVDQYDTLSRVCQIPVYNYNYISQNRSVRHIGVMAQDFYEKFGCGEDDQHIYAIDEAGVCISAIQALEKQVRELREEVAFLHRHTFPAEDNPFA